MEIQIIMIITIIMKYGLFQEVNTNTVFYIVVDREILMIVFEYGPVVVPINDVLFIIDSSLQIS